MARKALVMVDEPSIARLIGFYLLQSFAFEVDTVTLTEQALATITNESIQLVVLDVKLNGVKSGLATVKKIRKLNSQIPIIILSSCDREEDIIEGLESGADEYMSIPFKIEEFLARVTTILRRTGFLSTCHSNKLSIYHSYQTGRITIYPEKNEVVIDHAIVPFRPKELELLYYLIQNAGMIITRKVLLDEIWGTSYVGGLRTVDVHMSIVRKKLGTSVSIASIRGIGYKLCVNDTEKK
jgi:two-component system alkaline phosphatase synthesis response regulator PhoP